MGMKLKSGADLCGFQLTNFCVQGEASAPSDAALGRKYFHTNATDDVATGISLLNRERIYLGEGIWRATAYLDDIAAINEKLNLITGDTDTDTLINNLKDLEEFLKDFSETDKLKSLLDGKLSTSGGTIRGSVIISGNAVTNVPLNIATPSMGDTGYIRFGANFTANELGHLGFSAKGVPAMMYEGVVNTLIHSGNIGSQKVAGLAKSVTIWGNSFDGTQDVEGHFFFSNSKYITSYDTKGDEVRLMNLSGSNEFSLGYYVAQKGYSTNISGNNIYLKSGTSNNIGLILNSSGNVTIGASDLAGANLKMYVDGKAVYRGAILADRYNGQGNTAGASLIINKGADYFGFGPSATNVETISFGTVSDTNGTWKTEMVSIYRNGNVLIGTTTDNGAKLQVNGTPEADSLYVRGHMKFSAGGIKARNGYGIVWLDSTDHVHAEILGYKNECILSTNGQEALRIKSNGDVHITGNLIVDKEVSAGGAGAEEGTSGSGSAEGVSEIFTPTSTSMAFDHNLGEDVIVQVYEKSGNVWNMVMVDTEITSATRVTLRFGKTETTQHKVVIMGV